MPAPKGNQFWKIASNIGRNTLFENPEILWEESCKYFQWCIDNPLQEEVIINRPWTEEVTVDSIDGKGNNKPIKSKITHSHSKDYINKMRVFTIQGLCHFLNCNTAYFRNFEQNNKNFKVFNSTLIHIQEIIYRQKFEGAAGGFLKENLIIRDLKLKDTSEIEHSTRLIELQPAEVKLLQADTKGDYGMIPEIITIDIDHEEVE